MSTLGQGRGQAEQQVHCPFGVFFPQIQGCSGKGWGPGTMEPQGLPHKPSPQSRSEWKMLLGETGPCPTLGRAPGPPRVPAGCR